MTRQRAFKRRIRQHMSERSVGYAAARAELIASAAHRKGSIVSNQANESAVVEENIPYLRVTDARAAAAWYRRLGYQTEWEHKFGPDFPMTISVARNGRAGTRLLLSEHTGDATPDTLIYVRVADVDTIAAEFEAEIKDSGWAREVWLSDPDGNRVRVGTPTPASRPTEEFTYDDPASDSEAADA